MLHIIMLRIIRFRIVTLETVTAIDYCVRVVFRAWVFWCVLVLDEICSTLIKIRHIRSTNFSKKKSQTVPYYFVPTVNLQYTPARQAKERAATATHDSRLNQQAPTIHSYGHHQSHPQSGLSAIQWKQFYQLIER